MIDSSKSKSYPRTSSAIRNAREEAVKPRPSNPNPAEPFKSDVLNVEAPIRKGKKTIEDAPSLGEEQAP